MKNWILISALALLLASCDKEKQECPGSTEKTFAITGFTKIKAGDAHHVTVTKGNEFSIKANGCTSDLNDLELSLDANHILDIKYKNHKSNRYRVDFTITMPISGTTKFIWCIKRKCKWFWGTEYSNQNCNLRCI